MPDLEPGHDANANANEIPRSTRGRSTLTEELLPDDKALMLMAIKIAMKTTNNSRLEIPMSADKVFCGTPVEMSPMCRPWQDLHRAAEQQEKRLRDLYTLVASASSFTRELHQADQPQTPPVPGTAPAPVTAPVETRKVNVYAGGCGRQFEWKDGKDLTIGIVMASDGRPAARQSDGPAQIHLKMGCGTPIFGTAERSEDGTYRVRRVNPGFFTDERIPDCVRDLGVLDLYA